MENYYSKTNTGGAATSRGFTYQDLCTIKYFLDHVDRDNFISLTLEQTDDFSILFKENKETNFQVKNYKLNKTDIGCVLPRDIFTYCFLRAKSYMTRGVWVSTPNALRAHGIYHRDNSFFICHDSNDHRKFGVSKFL